MISPTDTDELLLQQSKEGNQAAFKELVQRYESQVAATVVGMLGNGAEAEDVGQEVFIRFYRSLEKFRGESALGTYLTRIAINLSLNAIKKRKRRNILSMFNSSEDSPEMQIPEQGLGQEERDTQAMVQSCLQQLDPQFRSVLILRMIEGYSTKETADILELPLGTVLSRLSRGQKKLKEIMIKMGGLA